MNTRLRANIKLRTVSIAMSNSNAGHVIRPSAGVDDEEDDMLGDLIYKHSITAKVRARAAATAKEPSENTDGGPPQRQPPRRAWQQCAAEGPQSANRQQVSAAM